MTGTETVVVIVVFVVWGGSLDVIVTVCGMTVGTAATATTAFVETAAVQPIMLIASFECDFMC